MSSQDRRESPLATSDAIDGGATQPQAAPRHPDSASDNLMQRDDSGSSTEGSYREQDYGGEPTHPPTEPEAA